MSKINYEGITEAELILGLYNGTPPLGMGFLHHINGLTLEQVQAELKAYNGDPHFDYYHGHPLKVRLDTTAKEFEGRSYDRDAGEGAAQKVVDNIRARKAA